MTNSPTNEQQQVLDYEGNTVVTAKPGSGKTFTIVEKIARIIPNLPDHKGIIAISFTNKASDELKHRCKKRCKDTKQSFFGTIDKFYISQIIIPFAPHITGKACDYEIIDTFPDNIKNTLPPESTKWVAPQLEAAILAGLMEGKIYLEFSGETAITVLRKAPGVIKYLKARYTHIFIDEYQDCGKIQDGIFRSLVEKGLTGIAVGDVNQAIYGFTNRFPEYLIRLIGNSNFCHFELTKNHRCHESISDYSLCLFNASHSIPKEKRVFWVTVQGSEQQLAEAIDSYISRIKDKYQVFHYNEIAVLCKSNSSAAQFNYYLKTPHKLFAETELDKNNSDWGRFFRDVLFSRFDESIYAVDFAETLFEEEYEPVKYRVALQLCQKIFDCRAEDICNIEKPMVALAQLVYPKKQDAESVSILHNVLTTPDLIRNYIPASENEINIMTLHKSKGLEFGIVFHMDLYKWIFPYEQGTPEEKRQDINLHYVGITRAKEVCYIMNGTLRYRSKQHDYVKTEPSPFLFLPGLCERRHDVNW